MILPTHRTISLSPKTLNDFPTKAYCYKNCKPKTPIFCHHFISLIFLIQFSTSEISSKILPQLFLSGLFIACNNSTESSFNSSASFISTRLSDRFNFTIPYKAQCLCLLFFAFHQFPLNPYLRDIAHGLSVKQFYLNQFSQPILLG